MREQRQTGNNTTNIQIEIERYKLKPIKMHYRDFETYISSIRLAKYKLSCGGNTRKTMKLYRANIRLSQEFLAILGVFEIAFRNKIDSHYKKSTGEPEWMLKAILPMGFLTTKGCENSLKQVVDSYAKLGLAYTHDKLVAKLSFGFWKYLLMSKQFQAGGSTLLNIFPQKPHNTNNTDVYKKLDKINSIRNRVAHHEPICFDSAGSKSSIYARQQYQEILDLLGWMSINSGQLFYGVDKVIKECNYIDSI